MNTETSPKTIIIVEDDISLQSDLKNIFTKEGFGVKTAENGVEALKIIQDNHVDLILLDLNMPVMDGINFYAQLKNVGKDYIPVIVLTNLNPALTPDTVKEVLIKSDVSLTDIVAKVKMYLN